MPASSDPEGKDIVEGAVIAAEEHGGNVRLYKITHVDDYPPPMGYEYHMIAYDPVCKSFEIAASTWKKHETKIAYNHIEVRALHFLPRAHRVLFVEPVTPDEYATYTKSRDSRGTPMPMPILNQPAPH